MSDSTDLRAPPSDGNPFGQRAIANRANAGTVAVEQERAIAEAQGKMVIARKFPRDKRGAFTEIMESCDRPGFAEDAIYTYSRGGKPVTGGTIRLAEEIARCWGNIEYGLRELSRRDGESEMEAFAWDLETNNRTVQAFTVRHLRDVDSGAKKLTSERDIYEIGANMGARRLRERIFAVIPSDVKQAAETRCREIIAGRTNVPKLIQAFAAIGVTADMLARRMGKPAVDALPEEIVDLRGIYQSIRRDGATIDEWFPVAGEKTPPPTNADGSRRPRALAAVTDAAPAAETAQDAQEATQAPEPPPPSGPIQPDDF